MLGHKTSLSKFKRIQVISSIFCRPQWYKTRKLEQEENGKNANVQSKWHVTRKPMGQWRNQRGNQKIPQDKLKWKHNTLESMGCNKISTNRELDNNKKVFVKKQEKSQINNLTYNLKELENVKQSPKSTDGGK